MRVLVTGGAGYIGAILCRQLLEAGHRPVVLDRLFWGRKPLAGLDVEIVAGDLRDFDDTWLAGIDGVCHLAGLSNDPTAEYNTAANWQMNAVGTERLVEACRAHGIRRFTFASSASIYDSEASSHELSRSPVMCDETTVVEPRGAYSLSKKYAEDVVLRAADTSFAPVVFRQGTVYGYSPRMRFDLVVNTFLKDAIVLKRLYLHGGGWMWRPLVDVEDVAAVHVAALAAPLDVVRGQIFNVLEENYQIRQLAMLVAGSLSLVDPPVKVDLQETPLPSLVRNYRMSNAKLSKALGFTPSKTVLESLGDMLKKLPLDAVDEYGDPRYYNIRWMTLLEEFHHEQRSFASIY
ncbi:MAG: SDR family oxidoreductase [Candidatus Eremiobacteraeota bacterium]|nr:SDR family oxidoreductase [Candidatus Eremiobacteraeota bacterium]